MGVGIKLRPEVRRFACLMELKLQWNDHKGGWSDMTNKETMKRIDEEIQEFWESIDNWDYIDNTDNKISVQGEAVDVANFLMMFLDNNKLL